MAKETLGQLIKTSRLNKKMSQQELAQKLNVTRQAVSNWENEISYPDQSLYVLLCKELNIDLEDVKNELLAVNNLALEGKPDDMVITSHICRGNYHSTFFTSGPYDSVADYVFAKENVDALLLEYDDARSGGFAPLKKVSPDKKVVLGLITTKTPELEDKETVIARIHEAAKYIPLDRLCLSPQCGFASCEIGNKLTEEQQWAKLKLVKEIAEEVWG